MEENPVNSGEKIKLLSFYLNDRLFALPMEDISEVNRIANLTFIENAPEYVSGLINLHGKITPVIDLKNLLSIESDDTFQNSMWVNVSCEKLSACLSVDKLSGFITVENSDIDTVSILSKNQEIKYINSYAKIDNEFLPILNSLQILRSIEATGI